jgi:hypothetical protein
MVAVRAAGEPVDEGAGLSNGFRPNPSPPPAASHTENAGR